MVDVLVTDLKGAIVRGLRATEFAIIDQNAPQEIAHFSQDEVPLAIALVVDVSGSMKEIIESLREALIKSLKSLKSGDRVALLSFHGRAKLEVELTNDFENLTRRIGRLKSKGSTNIQDAVFDAAQYLRNEAPRARRVIILVSDMVATALGTKPVMDAFVEAEVALFAVQTPSTARKNFLLIKDPSSGLPLQIPVRPEPVDKWAAASGGVFIDVSGKEGVRVAIAQLIQMLRTRYALGFYPDPPGKPGSIRKLEVRLKNPEIEKAMPGVILRYRTRYRVPPEPASEAKASRANRNKN
jgi:VWFA-related protein